jgi:hypothetical protein
MASPAKAIHSQNSSIKIHAHTEPSFLGRLVKAAAFAFLFFTSGAYGATDQCSTQYYQVPQGSLYWHDNYPHHDYGYEPGLAQLTNSVHTSVYGLCKIPMNEVRSFGNDLSDDHQKALAEYYLGRRLTCNDAKDRTTLLTGLAHMHRVGGLEVKYPKQGESFDTLFRRQIKKDSVMDHIDGSVLFVRGTLVCPSKEAFEKLKAEFESILV